MIKTFFPKVCPSCGEHLVIEQGDKEETLKLMCKNKECEGSLLKKLQKGIIALDIKGLGPVVIEDLMYAGITSSLDLFDTSKFNESTLISSGRFVKGRALEKVINSVSEKKAINIDKAILSLQLDNIGKTVSEKIGLLLSGMDADFTGLPYSVRDNMYEIKQEITEYLEKFEEYGVEIVRNKPKVILESDIKKVSKYVAIEDNIEIKQVVEKLGWEIVQVEDEKCQMFIGDNIPEYCTDNNIKCMSLKKLKLLFA